MFSRPINIFSTFFSTIPECWWWSPAPSWESPGHVFSNHACRTLCCPSQITPANAYHCSFNTANFWVPMAWFGAVRFRPLPPTLGVVINSEGFHEFWKVIRISVHSSLPISAYMWNIPTWCTQYLVNPHFKWWTWRGRGQIAPPVVGEVHWGVHLHLCFVLEGASVMISSVCQVWDTPQLHWEVLAEMSLSNIRQSDNPAWYWVAIHCTMVAKHHCDARCLPPLLKNMLAAH